MLTRVKWKQCTMCGCATQHGDFCRPCVVKHNLDCDGFPFRYNIAHKATQTIPVQEKVKFIYKYKNVFDVMLEELTAFWKKVEKWFSNIKFHQCSGNE